MYDLYFHKSPSPYKIAMFFEEAGLDYRTILVNVGRGEQFKEEFVAISPNSKVPVICDSVPVGGGAPLFLFESDAILLYLAEKENKLLPAEPRQRSELLAWLFWQAACQGPMCGQSVHFNMFAPENDYARHRYLTEAKRLFRVLDHRLKDREFVVGDEYSIVDIACYPWTEVTGRLVVGIESLDDFPHLRRWSDAVAARPATQRGIQRLRDDEEANQERGRLSLEEFATNMFGHDRERAKAAAASARPILTKAGVHFSG